MDEGQRDHRGWAKTEAVHDARARGIEHTTKPPPPSSSSPPPQPPRPLQNGFAAEAAKRDAPGEPRNGAEAGVDSGSGAGSSGLGSGSGSGSGPGRGPGPEVEEKTGPPKRRKVGHACVYCRRSHMTCDLSRPCTRCLQRRIGHLCHDEPRTSSEGRRGKAPVPRPLQIPGATAGVLPSPDVAPGPSDAPRRMSAAHVRYGQERGQQQQIISPMGPPLHFDSGPVGDGTVPAATGPHATTPTTAANAAAAIVGGTMGQGQGGGVMPNELHNYSNPLFSSSPHQLLQMHSYSTAYMFPPDVDETHEFNFINEFLAQSLNANGIPEPPSHPPPAPPPAPPPQRDLLTPYDRGSGADALALLSRSNHAPPNLDNGLRPQSTMTQQPNGHHPPARVPLPPLAPHPPTPALAEKKAARDQYYLQAAYPTAPDHQTPEQRIKWLLDSKHAAGLLKPFNYVNGYKRLGEYLDGSGVSPTARKRVLQALNLFRPRFRELARALTDCELVYVEMWFEAKLMEYDRVFASTAVPACCWRRTGEIYRANREMSELLGVSVDRLRDGKTALHEILTEESLVRYWEEFGTIAFDDTHGNLLSACELKHPDDGARPTIKCAFSMKIRWDEHKIPALIVGNFLPHDPAP